MSDGRSTDPVIPPDEAATRTHRPDQSPLETTAYVPAPPTAGDLPAIPGYEILKVLGRGGMGIVYEARQTALKRFVALKMILSGVQADEGERIRFRAEAEAVARLRHPNIVQIHEVGEHADRPFFTLEYVEGGSLAKSLAGEPQPPRIAAGLVETLAHGVHYAHEQGVVHRDLKPANVLMTAAGIPKITDFGLAKQLDSDSAQTQTGAVMGTPSYMAPEQASGQTQMIGPPADVYALGAILYELLTGRPPFKSASVLDTLQQVREQEPVPPSRLQPKVPRDLETICLKCLEKSPARRYASALALADDLDRFRQGLPILARPVGAVERCVKWARRNRAAAALLAAVVIGLSTITGVSVWFTMQLRDEGIRTRAALIEKSRSAADLAIDRSLAICARGDANLGLLWLIRDLQNLPPDCPDLEHAIRINLAAWQHEFSPLGTPLPHDDKVVAVAFSPDGKTFASASEDHTAKLWEVTDGSLHATLRHEGPVRLLSFSPDGQTLLTGSDDGSARLWKVDDGSASGELRHAGPIRSIVWHARELVCATGSDDGTARTWDTVTGKPRAGPFRHDSKVTGVAFHPDGLTLITGSADKTIRYWDIVSGQPLGQPLRSEAAIDSFRLCPSGELLATASLQEKFVRVWDTFSRSESTKLTVAKPQPFVGLEWAPGNLLAAAGWPCVVFDGATGMYVHGSLGLGGVARAVTFRRDVNVLVTGGDDGFARLFDRKQLATSAKRRLLVPLLHHEGAVLTVAYSPDGRRVGTGSADKMARLWHVPSSTANSVDVQRPLPHEAMSFAFRPDGRVLAVSLSDGTVRYYDPETGRPTGFLIRHDSPVSRVGFSSDGTVLATGASARHFWDAVQGTALGPPIPLSDSFAFTRNPRLVVVSSGTKVSWIDITTGRPHDSPLDCGKEVQRFALSPDEKTLVVVHGDHTAHLWDVATKEPRGELLLEGGIGYVAFSPDSQLVAAIVGWQGSGKIVRLWGTATGAPHGDPLLHQGAVWQFAFSPDSQLLATGSFDKMVRFWDTRTGKLHGLPLQHQGSVRALAFSPDGRMLASGDGEANGIYFWDVATCKMIGSRQDTGFGDKLAFSPDGKWLATRSEIYQGLRLARVPAAMDGTVDALTLWAQLRTGTELTAEGSLRTLDALTWHERRTRLQQLGGVPTHETPKEDVAESATLSKPQIACIGVGGETTMAAAVSADARFVLAAGGGTWRNGAQYAGKDYRIRMIDLVTRTIVRRFEGHGSYVSGLALAPGARQFASGAYDGTVRLWNLESGQEVRKLDVPRGYVSLAYLPDGRLLIGCQDGVTRLWDLVAGKEVRTFLRHVKSVYTLAVSADGRRFLTGGQDGKSYLWSVDSSEPVRLLEGHTSWVEGVAFYQDQRAVTIGYDKTLRVWDLSTGKELRRWEGDDRCLAISPDGRRALSGGTGRTVRLWDLESGNLLGSFEGHTSPVRCVHWLGQDRFLSAGHDHTLRVWRLPSN